MSRRWIIILYNLFVIALVFGAAEYLTRVFVYHRSGTKSLYSEALFDPWTAFRNNPNYAIAGVHETAQGFRRGRSVSLVKPANTVRLFLMGGSVIYGGDTLYPEFDHRWHITNAQTIDAYLEHRLNQDIPQKHWEVINAGVKGYLLHQDLALFLSVVSRYKPDYVLFLDGVNDLFALLRDPESFDPYTRTGYLSEFNKLTNPGPPHSLLFTFRTYLRNDSALFRWAEDSMSERAGSRTRRKRASQTAPPNPLHFADLSKFEQASYRTAAGELNYYEREVKQIHALLAIDGVHDLFFLQPFLGVSRKPECDIERHLVDYYRKVEDRIYLYGFKMLYPELAGKLARDASESGFEFADLTGIFDGMQTQAFTDYCHLTPDANRAVADKIFNQLVNTSKN